MFEIITNLDFTPFLLSFKLAFITTIILFILCLPLAWYLANTKSKLKPYIETITALPLVLPPSVLGFYILISLSSNSPFGSYLDEVFDIQLAFTFNGLVVASIFYSLPFMVQSLQNGFESLNKNMIESSYIAGKSVITTIFKVALPNIKPALLTALVITFAHTIGEFGVVLMVGGSIEGQTKVASIAIYELSEGMDYTNAHIYSALMLIISFIVLLSVYMFNAKQKEKLSGLK